MCTRKMYDDYNIIIIYLYMLELAAFYVIVSSEVAYSIPVFVIVTQFITIVSFAS